MVTLLVILGFGLTIFVHELGHFLMARRAGVTVEVFSIGIGPRLFTLFKDKHGTDWVLSAFPLGGFVKMKGQEDLPNPSKADTSDPGHFLNKTPMQKLSVIVAGVIMNVIFSYFLLVLAYSIGVPHKSNIVGGALPGYPAETAGFQPGDKVIQFNGEKVHTWEDLLTSVAMSTPEREQVALVERDGDQVELYVTPTRSIGEGKFEQKLIMPQIGLKPSFAIAGLSDGVDQAQSELIAGEIIMGMRFKGKEYQDLDILFEKISVNPGEQVAILTQDASGQKHVRKAMIGTTMLKDHGIKVLYELDVMPDGAAAKAGMQNQDIILAINRKKMKSWDDILQYGFDIKSSKPLKVKVRRGEEVLSLKVIPQQKGISGRYFLGIGRAQGSELRGIITEVSPWLASRPGAPKVGDTWVKTEMVAPSGLFSWVSQFWEVMTHTEMTDEKGYILHHFERNGSLLSHRASLKDVGEKEIGSLFRHTVLEKKVQYPPHLAAIEMIKRIPLELREIGLNLGNLVSGNISLKAMGGPLRIFETSHFVAKELGWAYFILLFAKIGFSLAVINILPIPVLDGGHAVLVIYEWIVGKPVPERFVMITQSVGVFIIMSFFMLIFYNDFSSIISRIL